MSRTTTFTVGDRGFWALADAFGVWVAYLVEEITRRGTASEPWLAALAERWRVSAAITDQGAATGELTDEQAAHLRVVAEAARERAEDVGDIPVERLRQWIILDDLPVASGCCRTGTRVEVSRVLEVADGVIALLAGDFAPDPPTGAWFLGTGNGFRVMEMESRTWPRLPRG
jgi:hypothetical protein